MLRRAFCLIEVETYSFRAARLQTTTLRCWPGFPGWLIFHGNLIYDLTMSDILLTPSADFGGTHMRTRLLTSIAGHEIAVPHFNFVLQPEFPLNALILATEALRIANQNSSRSLFAWNLVSESGQPVRASNGMWMSVDADVESLPDTDYCLVFEGNLPMQKNSPKLLSALRAAHRFGVVIGGIDTGAFALAQAGLIGDRDAVLHWETEPIFRERFPHAQVRDQTYLIDGQRVFAAGGVATLDLMLALIAKHYGEALASEVANALVYTPREINAPQRLTSHKKNVEILPSASVRPSEAAARLKSGTSSQSLLPDRLVSLMEKHVDLPLSLDEIAEKLGASRRTIIRTCVRRYGHTPMFLYLRIRLQTARNFLFYEELSIKDVALACGFSCPSAFSRAFKRQFSKTPRAFRDEIRRQQAQTLRPEIRRLAQTR